MKSIKFRKEYQGAPHGYWLECIIRDENGNKFATLTHSSFGMLGNLEAQAQKKTETAMKKYYENNC